MRFQPYLLGVFLGYILYKTRGKTVRIPKILNLTLWLISTAVALAVVFGTYKDRKHGYTQLDTAFYWGFSRLGWSMAIGWVIFSCVKGYGGVINSFLSCGPFLVMARLTYFIYLLHYDIIDMITSSFEFTIQFGHEVIVRNEQFQWCQCHVSVVPFQVFMYIGELMIITAASICATLAFEAPFIGLEKIIWGCKLSKWSMQSKACINYNSQFSDFLGNPTKKHVGDHNVSVGNRFRSIDIGQSHDKVVESVQTSAKSAWGTCRPATIL